MSYSDLASVVTLRPLNMLPRGVTIDRRRSPFRASWPRTVEFLANELRAHGARQAVLEIDMREQDFRLDGLPRAHAIARTPVVVLSFQAAAVPGSPQLRYEVGTYTHWQDNVRAIALGLEALRAVDRYGVTKRGEQYAGWRQLPSGADDAPTVERGRRLIAEAGSVAQALKDTHPDHGGQRIDFDSVQLARGPGSIVP